MRHTLMIALLLLTGCASTVQDVMETEPYDYDSALTPINAAHCLMRNAENMSGSIFSRLDQSPGPGVERVFIRQAEAGTFAIGEIKAQGSGSRITLRVSRNALIKEMSLAALTEGCIKPR